VARAVIDGISQSHSASGHDIGAEVEPRAEQLEEAASA